VYGMRPADGRGRLVVVGGLMVLRIPVPLRGRPLQWGPWIDTVLS
jgi:hypothetical protein